MWSGNTGACVFVFRVDVDVEWLPFTLSGDMLAIATKSTLALTKVCSTYVPNSHVLIPTAIRTL